ncbi:hypothetical protein DFQ26_000932 [Actinomortierella ambigua]|nr:hypothetical protein DFQ26_000932 [Actinomortierella ambigua]
MKSVIVSALLLVPAVVVVRAFEIINCNYDEVEILASAVERATSLVLASAQYLDGSERDTQRLTTWFGPYMPPPRFTTLKDHFNRLAEHGFSRFSYDCTLSTCVNYNDPGTVSPDRFAMIRLCPLFWALPTTGADSQAGALIRLSSMFEENGGAKPSARGQERCKELVKHIPDDAVQSACSYQYFAENSPPLP